MLTIDSTDTTQMLNPSDFGLPEYPTIEVVGPCVCGSWPGGKCLKCLVMVIEDETH